MRLVLELMTKEALAPPKVTLVVKLRFVPPMLTLTPTSPLVGQNPAIAGVGGAWPSTLLRSTAARFGGNAVKNVKPVSVCSSLTEVTKLVQGVLATEFELGIVTAMTRVR